MKIWCDPGALVFPFDYALEVGLFILLKKNTLLNIYDCIGSNIDSNESKIPPEGDPKGGLQGLDSERSTRAAET